MLASYCKSEDNSNCARLLGTVTQSHEGGLISDNTNLISANSSLLSETLANGGMDLCSFYSGPSEDAIFAFGEANGYSDYSGNGETCGSIASSYGGETCGSIASSVSSFSGGCSSSGGACSYSC